MTAHLTQSKFDGGGANLKATVLQPMVEPTVVDLKFLDWVVPRELSLPKKRDLPTSITKKSLMKKGIGR